MAIDLDTILPLRRASRYAFPKDPSAILPRVFGDYLDPAAVDPDQADGGMTPAVCVDRLNLVYVVNDGPAVAAQPQRFFNGTLQADSVAVWNPANNLEGLGLVATLTFSLGAVLDGEVSVRFGGSVDGAGAPITNPVSGLYYMLTQYAGWTDANFDRGTGERSMEDMTALGYPFYWCFQEEKTIREWLLEILPTYHTDCIETGNGQLAIILDRSLTTFTVYPAYHIPAYEIEDQGSPAHAMQLDGQADDVANRITLHGRHSWVSHESTQAYTWDYAQSQSSYQAEFPIDFAFRGMYTLAHATQWLNSFAIRHGFEPRTVRFALKGLKGIPLISPRFVTVEWPLFGWVEHLLKIRKSTISISRGQVLLDCIDCGRELSDTPTSPLASPTARRQQISRIFQWIPGAVGTQGNLLDAPVDTRNEAANGDFELGDDGSWDLQGRWTIQLDTDEAYFGQYYAQHVPGMGLAAVQTLRTRVDPGEWVLVSTQFAATAGADGFGVCTLTFYDVGNVLISVHLGTTTPASLGYLESMLFVQAPVTAHYYRPGFQFAPPSAPTTGTWRADHVFAVSGTQAEVIAARSGDAVSRNFVIGGDFELGDMMWAKNPGWTITNDPAASAHSGVWKAAHEGSAIHSGERRLTSLTKISVTPGQTFTLQAWVITLLNPNGTGRLGVTWLDGQESVISENGTPNTPGPFVAWALASGSMTVPAGAVYAKVWGSIFGHTLPNTYWLIDDMFVFT